MYIYVDESGPFVKPKQPHRVSAIAAVVVPQSQRRSLLHALKKRLTAQTPTSEIKGNELDEFKIAEILTIASEYDVIVGICAIDMGMQGEAEVKAAQQSHAAKVIAGLTPKHSKAIDLRKVFQEDFLLVNSRDDMGVRLADVVVSAFTRGVNGTLRESGWLALGPLLVRGPRDSIRMIQLSQNQREPEMVITPYGSVIRRMTEQARDILRSR